MNLLNLSAITKELPVDWKHHFAGECARVQMRGK